MDDTIRKMVRDISKLRRKLWDAYDTIEIMNGNYKYNDYYEEVRDYLVDISDDLVEDIREVDALLMSIKEDGGE